MCTHYPALSTHSVESGVTEAEEAEGGAEGCFSEKGLAESVVEGRILEGVAEEGINKNEGLKKRHPIHDEAGGVTASIMVGGGEGVAEVVVNAVVTEEDVAENGEGAAEGEVENEQDNKQGNDKGEAEGGADRDDSDDVDDEGENAEELDESAGVDGVIGGDGLGIVEGGSGNAAAAGVFRVVQVAGHTREENGDAVEGEGVGEGFVWEEGIVEGFITDGGIAQGAAEKGVAQGAEDWDIREGIEEESIAAESVVDGGGVEVGVALIREEIVREQIENCVHKLSPGFLGVTWIGMDMSHCSNALLVACITHTHKN